MVYEEGTNHVSLFFSLASLSYFSRVLLSTCPVRYLERNKKFPNIDLLYLTCLSEVITTNNNWHVDYQILEKIDWCPNYLFKMYIEPMIYNKISLEMYASQYRQKNNDIASFLQKMASNC